MNNSNPGFLIFLFFIALWQFFWKVIAVWRSARENQKGWFAGLILLFYFNTLGLPEIIYLFWFSKRRLTIDELASWFHQAKKRVRRHRKD
jgi:hypothetical protein